RRLPAMASADEHHLARLRVARSLEPVHVDPGGLRNAGFVGAVPAHAVRYTTRHAAAQECPHAPARDVEHRELDVTELRDSELNLRARIERIRQVLLETHARHGSWWRIAGAATVRQVGHRVPHDDSRVGEGHDLGSDPRAVVDPRITGNL